MYATTANKSVSMDKLLPVCLYQDAVRVICIEVEALVKKCGKPKMLDAIKLPPPELYKHVEVCFTPTLLFNGYHSFFSLTFELAIYILCFCFSQVQVII
jgi:hypothetical protein